MTPVRYHTVCDITFRSDLQLQILCASNVTFCMQEKFWLLPHTRRRTGPI